MDLYHIDIDTTKESVSGLSSRWKEWERRSVPQYQSHCIYNWYEFVMFINQGYVALIS